MLSDVVAPRAALVVVLAVDVGGDRSADGHVAGAGGDRHEEAAGHEVAHQRVDAGAGRGPHDAGGRVEVEVAHAGGVDHPAAGVLGAVAVAPAEAAGDDAPRPDAVERRGPGRRPRSARPPAPRWPRCRPSRVSSRRRAEPPVAERGRAQVR